MLRDRATCEANHKRFVEHVAKHEAVYALKGSAGIANCEAVEFEETRALLFFSDEAYARRAIKQSFEGFEVMRIDLFDFLFRWLPGMSGDGVVAGTNWTGDLAGLEFEPFELREEIDAALSPDQLKRHEDRFHAATDAATSGKKGGA
jgi:hypothetical protein